MKIGILTYTREFANLGTNMQAYCTLKAVQKAHPGAGVELIDFCQTHQPWRPYLSSVSFQSLKKDYVRMRKYERFFREEFIFGPGSLVTTDVPRALDFISNSRYDAIYVGADTILELKHASPGGLTPYWLDARIPRFKFLAAASSHSLTYEALSVPQRRLIERTLKSFSLLGARDEATLRLLRSFVGDDDPRLALVPDPTFTYDIDYSHIERYFAERQLSLKTPMVCLHLVRDMPWAAELAARFRRAGYLVASLRPARYADVLFTDLAPFEQLGLYRFFDLVITHRFHDVIFCLKNLTPVMAFPENVSDTTRMGESKMATLLNTFGLGESSLIPKRTALDPGYLFECYASTIRHFRANRTHIESILGRCRRQYESFLSQSADLVAGRASASVCKS